MADEQYQADWSEVGLPDTSSDWTIGKALQQYANPTPVVVTPDNSSLNTALDKQTMADIDWTGEHDPTNTGATHSSDTKPGWAQLPQPGTLEAGEHGSGYYTYGTDQTGKSGTGPNGQWGDPRTAETIAAVADRLAMGKEFTPFGVGNISLAGGGRFKGHKEHRDGLDIDVRPARTDGAQAPVTYKDPCYDRAATQRLIDAFRATGQAGAIYFNDPEVHGVQPSEGHDNHFHVKLNR